MANRYANHGYHALRLSRRRRTLDDLKIGTSLLSTA